MTSSPPAAAAREPRLLLATLVGLAVAVAVVAFESRGAYRDAGVVYACALVVASYGVHRRRRLAAAGLTGLMVVMIAVSGWGFGQLLQLQVDRATVHDDARFASEMAGQGVVAAIRLFGEIGCVLMASIAGSALWSLQRGALMRWLRG